MNILCAFGCRIYQTCFHLALPLLPYREPQILEHISYIPEILHKQHLCRVLLVTDHDLRQAGCTQPLETLLQKSGFHLAVYDETCQNPTVENAEAAAAMYLREQCQAIIAFGGGSPIDCAKAAGAKIVYPRKKVRQLGGLLKVWRRLPLLIAIPTTAGTGSETTLTAVITDPATKHKYTMNDFTLIPRYAVLDSEVTRTLPPALTATTGMDALTHAVEAFIGRSTSRETRALAVEAVRLIFENLPKAYADGQDLNARKNMLLAAYKAGIAFSKSYVGYVHAIAHSLGGQYGIPHGLANAVLLPIVLRDYGKCAGKKLAILARAAGVADTNDSQAAAADKFITAIEDMNRALGIPYGLPGIQTEDIPKMARHAAHEANPLYPVPKLMDARELSQFYEMVSDRRDL